MDKKLKSTKVSKYDFSGEGQFPEQLKGEGIRHSKTEFDEKGNTTLEVRYDDDGRFESKETKEFDKEGHLIEEKNYISEREIADHKTYELDDKGKVLKAFKHYQDDSKDTINYEYDADGNLVARTTIDSYDEEESCETAQYENGKVVRTELIEYDELMKWESFELDKEGKILVHKIWQQDEQEVTFKNSYDERGNLIKTLVYNEKNELTGKSLYSYNADNQMQSIEEETPYGSTSTKITRDKNGNAIEQTEYNAKGEINNSVQRKFNENNDVVETKVFINMQGRDVDQYYVLKYEHEYFD
ncbi:MAG: hypothetical protein GXO89_04440 [Chlorobi bacterium]|nr:hypothetical protein [Chlorobiota bacterium]